MDSKLKRLTILAACSVLVLVVLVVVLVNGGIRLSTPGMAQATNSPVPETSEGMIYQNGQVGNDLSAFLKDDTFFDSEDNAFLDELLKEQNRLSLIVTSVEKDLRIQIVDKDNKPVKGESFYVTLSDMGEYKDLDKDGIIYIGDIPAGEYTVSLKPMEGYTISSGGTRVRVKEEVEYVVINDISLLIKTEADIDAELEDTAQIVDDGDKTEIKGPQTLSGKAVLGIDVSKWQEEIDWDKVKNDGVEFVIIRCGYRGSSTGALVIDPYFEANIKGATAAGLDVGVYFFTQAVNTVEAVEEASMVVQLVEKYDLTYPIFIDTEGAGGDGRADGVDVETRTAVCEAFCTTVKNAGYEAGVYASRNWLNTKVDADELDKYVVWLAEYRSAPLYQGYYSMWQYTSKGKIDGIKGNVDMNISYLGY